LSMERSSLIESREVGAIQKRGFSACTWCKREVGSFAMRRGKKRECCSNRQKKAPLPSDGRDTAFSLVSARRSLRVKTKKGPPPPALGGPKKPQRRRSTLPINNLPLQDVMYLNETASRARRLDSRHARSTSRVTLISAYSPLRSEKK